MKLTSLVEAEDDPEIYAYVIRSLRPLPPVWHPDQGKEYYPYKVLLQLRTRLIHKFILVPGRRVEELLQIAELQKQQEVLELLVRKLLEEKPDVLREKLRDPNPTVRWLAAQVVGGRRLPLGRELTGLLTDREPEVAQAARQALVRLGRGADFGPSLWAGRSRRERAAQRWREWLALQDPPAKESRPDRLELIPYGLISDRDRRPSRER